MLISEVPMRVAKAPFKKNEEGKGNFTIMVGYCNCITEHY